MKIYHKNNQTRVAKYISYELTTNVTFCSSYDNFTGILSFQITLVTAIDCLTMLRLRARNQQLYIYIMLCPLDNGDIK